MIYRVAMEALKGEPFPAGTEVALTERTYGYEAGTKGIVVRSNPETVLVRFDPTGHTVPVARDLLASPVRQGGEGEMTSPASM